MTMIFVLNEMEIIIIPPESGPLIPFFDLTVKCHKK